MTDNGSHMTSNWVLFHGLGGEEIVIQRYAVVAVLPALNTYMPYTVIVSDGGTRWIVREHPTEVTSARGITPGETPTYYEQRSLDTLRARVVDLDRQVTKQMATIDEQDLEIERLNEELASLRIVKKAGDEKIASLVKSLNETTEVLKAAKEERDRTQAEVNRLRYGDFWRGDVWKPGFTGTYGTSAGLGDYAKWPGTKD